jgi:pantothenate synthetase
MEEMAKGGDRSVAALIEAGKQEVSREPGVRLDYLEIVDSDTLEPLADVRTGSLVAIAALVGTTRLIDNIVISSR